MYQTPSNAFPKRITATADQSTSWNLPSSVTFLQLQTAREPAAFLPTITASNVQTLIANPDRDGRVLDLMQRSRKLDTIVAAFVDLHDNEETHFSPFLDCARAGTWPCLTRLGLDLELPVYFDELVEQRSAALDPSPTCKCGFADLALRISCSTRCCCFLRCNRCRCGGGIPLLNLAHQPLPPAA